MSFNSPLYLVFLILVVPIFYYLPKKIDKIFFLLASYLFYAYWDWRFLFLLIGSTLMDYYLGELLFRAKTDSGKKMLLFFSVFINLAVLAFFKYYGFFVHSFETSFGLKLDYMHLKVLLPLGISFYTFQSLSYTIDIYRERLEPTKSLLDYCLFVGIFPHLMGSPLNMAAFVQLDAAIPNYFLQEAHTGADALNDILDEPLRRDGGYVVVPDRPGIGVEVREEMLARFPYRPYTIRGWYHADGSVAH